MKTEGTFEERLELLPKDIRQVLSSLPRDKAEDVLAQLLQPAELRYGALEERHVDSIKVSLIMARGDGNETQQSVAACMHVMDSPATHARNVRARTMPTVSSRLMWTFRGRRYRTPGER